MDWNFKGYKGKKGNQTDNDFLYYEDLDELLEHKDISKALIEHLIFKVEEYAPDGVGFEFEDEGFRFTLD